MNLLLFQNKKLKKKLKRTFIQCSPYMYCFILIQMRKWRSENLINLTKVTQQWSCDLNPWLTDPRAQCTTTLYKNVLESHGFTDCIILTDRILVHELRIPFVVKWMASGKLLHSTGRSAGYFVKPRGVGQGGWEGGSRGRGYGDICIHTADSLCCTAETNTTL